MGWLSSLRVSVWVLAGLSLWLGLGAVLAQSAPLDATLRGLDQATLQAWLRETASGQPWGLAWLAVLGLLAASMAVNLTACAWSRLWCRTHVGDARRWLVLAAHAATLAVIFLQGASFFTGHSLQQVKLTPGQSAQLPGGMALRLEQVTYVADPALLGLNRRQARHRLTRTDFDRRANLARVTFLRDGAPADGGAIGYFEPLEHAGWRAHLVGFHKAEGGGPGAVLNLGRSPLWWPFAAAYGLLLACFLCLAASEALNLAGRRRAVGCGG